MKTDLKSHIGIAMSPRSSRQNSRQATS